MIRASSGGCSKERRRIERSAACTPSEQTIARQIDPHILFILGYAASICVLIAIVKHIWRHTLTLTALVCFAAAQVKITQQKGRVQVEIGGKAFGDLYTAPDAPKPYFAPLRSVSGKIVTRQWPMVKDSGETQDHQHHRGMWLGYIDVNGVNFWENEFSYKKPNAGKIVAHDAVVAGSTVRLACDWLAPDGKKLLTDKRTMTFYSDPELRIVDFDATLTATVQVVFNDDKDGAFAVRMADPLTEKTGTGVLTSSEGGRTMKEVWGKPANWVDYSGTLDGEALGITIMDHPTSFHHPARWHARDYGLLAANPFADHAYDPAAAERKVTLRPGESVRLRYRVLVHSKMDRAAIDRLYKVWVGL
jgi:hypothetical protein